MFKVSCKKHLLQLQFYAQDDNPSNTNLNALELYMLSCMVFVVAALIEFAVVVTISRSSKTLNNKLRVSLRASNSGGISENRTDGEPRLCWEEGGNIGNVTEIGRQEDVLSNSAYRWIAYMVLHINKIDIVSFFAYLFIFVLFNCHLGRVYILECSVSSKRRRIRS